MSILKKLERLIEGEKRKDRPKKKKKRMPPRKKNGEFRKKR